MTAADKATASADAQAILDAFATARIVDLSVLLGEDMPASWPGHMPFRRTTFHWYGPQPSSPTPPQVFAHSRGPYHTAWWVIDEHTGTHFDAPTHFIPPPDSGLPLASELGAQTGDLVTLDRLIGPAAVIDATEYTGQGGDGISPEIPPSVVEAWEREHGTLRAGEIVLFRTGWDRFYRSVDEGGAAYCADPVAYRRGPGWPTPEIATLQVLLDRGVTTVGIDGASMGSSHDGVPLHQFGLGNGMIFIEQLTNLDQLPPRGALFLFLPVKVRGASGGPGRAAALIPDVAR